MEDKKLVCNFCHYTGATKRDIGLFMCYKCHQRYYSICSLYLETVKREINAHCKGWMVSFLNECNRNTESSFHTIFYIAVMKENVRLITSIDRAAFFSTVSRLSSDLQNCSTKKTSVTVKGKRKASGR